MSFSQLFVLRYGPQFGPPIADCGSGGSQQPSGDSRQLLGFVLFKLFGVQPTAGNFKSRSVIHHI